MLQFIFNLLSDVVSKAALCDIWSYYFLHCCGSGELRQ